MQSVNGPELNGTINKLCQNLYTWKISLGKKIPVYYLNLCAYKKLLKGICNQPSPQGMVCSLIVGCAECPACRNCFFRIIRWSKMRNIALDGRSIA